MKSEFQLTADKSDLLYGSVEDLGVEFGYERSFKLLEQMLLVDRFIVTVGQDAVEKNTPEGIFDVCRRMDMPAELLDHMRKYMHQAQVIHFGIEGVPDGCIVKAYLEFPQRPPNPETGRPDPYFIYFGYKWDAVENGRHALSKYTCYPEMEIRDIYTRLSELYGPKHRDSYDIVKNVTEAALSRILYYELFYSEVAEEGNPRNSYDLALYKANLRMEEIESLLQDICNHYSIPLEDFNEHYLKIKQTRFGHISGGINREGRDFFTVYFGAEGRRKGDPR